MFDLAPKKEKSLGEKFKEGIAAIIGATTGLGAQEADNYLRSEEEVQATKDKKTEEAAQKTWFGMLLARMSSNQQPQADLAAARNAEATRKQQEKSLDLTQKTS